MSKKSTDIGVGKKVLASALSAAMVVAFAPAVAMADTNTDNNDIPVVHTVEGAVAQVGDQQYASLQGALEAANNGEVVKLLDDILLEPTQGESGHLNPQMTLEGKSLTLNMDGHKLSYSPQWINDNPSVTGTPVLIAVGDNASLTVTGDGTFDAELGNNGSYGFNVNGENAKLAIENGCFYAAMTAVQVQKGSAVINGGYFDLSSTIKNSFPNYSTYLINNIDANITNGTASFAVAGGTFVGFDPSHTTCDSAPGNYLVRGFGVVHDAAADTYTVSDPVAAVDGVKYGSLRAAVDGAKNGETVTLLSDISVTSLFEVKKNVDFDLGGYTLSRDGGSVLDLYGKTTFKNGKVLVTNANGNGAIWVNGTAELEIADDVTVEVPENCFDIAYDASCTAAKVTVRGKLIGDNGITMNGQIKDGAANALIIDGATIDVTDHGIYQAGCAGTSFSLKNSIIYGLTGIEVRAGKLVVDNCTVKGGNAFECKANGNGATTDGAGIAIAQHTTKYAIDVTINGGDISGAKAVYESNPQNNDAESIAKVKLAINGGTFTGPVECQDLKKFISAGTFSVDPTAYLADGSVVYKKHSGSDYSYIVQASDAAQPANSSGYNYWTSSDGKTYTEGYSAPVTPVDPTPTPTPEPAAPGTNVSGTDSAGNTVEATVTDNNKTTLPDGTEAAGSVEFKGTTSGSGSGQPTSEAAIPSTVTSNGSTYVVTKIAAGAFEGQEQLTKVTIPETVVEIGSKAFANTSISSVVIPAATTAIGAGVFQGCDDLESVDISKAALTSIPADAFNGTAISSISIPGTVKSVGARAFKGTALKSVELPAATTTLGTAAFQGCASLKSADISKAALTEIPAYAFNGASITSIDIPDTVKTIGKRAFKKTKLKAVSTDAESLERGAFSGCASLKSASLPEVTEIGEYAFYGNDALKTLTTGADLEAIGPKAFKGAGKFKVLRINSKRLTKSGVKGSLKGSAVTKVEVAVTGSKKTQDKYVKRYSKFFAKANSGKSVKVVKAKKAAKK